MNRDKPVTLISCLSKAARVLGTLGLVLAALVSACTPPAPTPQASPESSTPPAPLATPTLKQRTPTCSQTCTPVPPSVTPEAATLQAVKSSPPAFTKTPVAGDLGWGKAGGRITNANNGEPIAGAGVTCEHFSYTTPAGMRCRGSTSSGQNGRFVFEDVYFHDTDTISLRVEAPGYAPETYRQDFFTQALLQADIQLTPLGITPIIMCTPPLCAIGTSEVYYCPGVCPGGCGTTCATYTPTAICTPPSCGPYESLNCPSGDCPGGCGLVCATPAAVCTPPLCAIGTSEVYYCPGVCPGGCGTTCATYTPQP